MQTSKITASLYIHIPFCGGMCGYCNFYSEPVAGREALLDRYIDRVIADTEHALEHCVYVPTVYIGGGTPSVLGHKRLGWLLSALNDLLPAEPAEFTVEANPESADTAFYETCRRNKVGRVSLGVQTFHESSRRAVSRIGALSAVRESLEHARAFYPAAFSLDLIAGLPQQTDTDLCADIETALSFEPAHISLYALSLEEGTPLGDHFKQLTYSWRRAALERIDKAWIMGRDMLEQKGYSQYEVSNFSAGDDRVSAHNLRYWRMENWLGIGAGASGTIIDDEAGIGIRRAVPASIDTYLAGCGAEEETLDSLTLMKETFLMGFRTRCGPDAALFEKRFKSRVEDRIPKTIAAWRSRGLFEPDTLALTREGLLFLDAFLIEAFGEIG